MNVRFNLSHDIKITLKFHFCRKTLYCCHYVCNVVMDGNTFPEMYKTVFKKFICIGEYIVGYGRTFSFTATRKWFIAWRYFTTRRDVI